MPELRAGGTVAITDRDRELLTFLHLLRWMTIEHAAHLAYRSTKVAHRRLSKLVASGHLQSVPLPGPPHFGHQRLAYGADARGTTGASRETDVRRPKGRASEVPSLHQIEIVDVLVAFHRHAKSTGGRLSVDFIPEWCSPSDDGARFRHPLEMVVPHPRRPSMKLALKPDAAIVLASREARKSLLFLELDRGTEPLEFTLGRESIRMKLEAYDSLYESGAFGHLSASFGFTFRGFRVLFVCPTVERVAAILRLAGGVGGSRVFAAPLERVRAVGPLSRVWSFGGAAEAEARVGLVSEAVRELDEAK